MSKESYGEKSSLSSNRLLLENDVIFCVDERKKERVKEFTLKPR
jgi:hypothetical protein